MGWTNVNGVLRLLTLARSSRFAKVQDYNVFLKKHIVIRLSHGEGAGTEEVLPAESGGHQGEDEGKEEQTAGQRLGPQQTVQDDKQKQW